MMGPLPLLVAFVAAFPGLASWWTGRSLARLTDDPALPELLMARQQRLLVFVATSAAILFVTAGEHVAWGLLLLAVLLLIGGYPLRRTLLGETASLPTYLWRTAKTIVGGMGFWILLAWTPMIVLDVDPRWWPLSLALVPILILWEHFHPRIWLRLHDAEPLASAELAPRIASIVERAGIAAPALYRIGAPGTRFPNAVALPSVRRPAIGLGNALVELLEPDETAAIYAHELAHIEHFSPRVIRRLQAVNRLLILAAVVLPLLVRWLAPDAARWVVWTFPFAVLFMLIQRGKQSQQHETESDLRAAALCGDPDAVARALVKVHVHAWIPRRWPVDFERNASHPSLARRIQALRGQGAEAVSSLGAPTILRTAREGSVVAFDDARAWWFDGVPPETAADLDALRAQASSTRSVAWADLVELRVTASGEGRALQASHRNGDRWSVPLAPTQVAAAQKALDVVDVRFHRDLGKRPWQGARLTAAAIFLAMTASSLVGVLLIPLALVVMRPSAIALGALGAMVVGRVSMAVLLGEAIWVPDLPVPVMTLGALALLGVAALVLAWHQARRSGSPGNPRLTLWVLGATAGFLAVGALWGVGRTPALGTYMVASAAPALSATLLGLAAALFLVPRPRLRWWSAASAAGAVAAAAPLIASSMPPALNDGVAREVVQAVETGRLPLGETVMGLRLSPGGTRFLVQRYDERGYSRVRRPAGLQHIVGDSAGIRREVAALQVEFVDDARVLALYAADSALELRLESADSAMVLWTTMIPDVYEPTLAVSPLDGAWTVVGEEVGGDSLLVIAGGLSSPESRSRRFAPLDSIAGMGFIVFDGGARVVVPVFARNSQSTLPMLFMMLSPGSTAVDLWQVDSTGHRSVGLIDGFPQCGTPDEGRALCFVRGPRSAAVWTVTPNGPEVATRRFQLPGALTAWVGPGARLTALSPSDRITHVDLAAEPVRVIEVELPAENGTYEARLAAGRLATLRGDSTGASLVFYRLP